MSAIKNAVAALGDLPAFGGAGAPKLALVVEPDPIRDALPLAMIQAKRWLVWRSIPQTKGKPRKVPSYANGSPRGATDTPEDRAHLADYDTARQAVDRGGFTGLGFALGPDGTDSFWQGIDLDGIDERPELAALAGTLPGYVERSPSGKGVHALGYGEVFPSLASRSTGPGAGIEAYAAGRFFTVTGERVGRGEIADISEFVRRTLAPMRAAPDAGIRSDVGSLAPLGAVDEWSARVPDARELSPDQVRDVRSALFSLRSDDRGLWIKLGHALAAHGDQGRGLWLEWGSVSDKFDAADASRVWDSLNPTSGINYRAVLTEAQAAGWVNPATHAAPVHVEIAGEPGERRLLSVALDDIMSARIERPTFVVEDIIPRGFTSLLGGHGGSGKSNLALTWAAHVAGGKAWGPLSVQGGRALYVSLEDDGALLRYRLKRIIEAYGLDAAKVMGGLVIADGSANGVLAFEHVDGGARRLTPTSAYGEVCTLAMGMDLVVVDNASDGFDADENSKRLVRAFIKMLTKAVKDHNGAMLLLAHIDKAGAKFGTAGNSFSGSVAWNNSVRSRLALVDDALHHEKSNLSAKHAPIPLMWNGGGVLMPAAEMKPGESADDDAVVLAILKKAVQSGVNIPATEAANHSAWHRLKTQPGFPYGLMEPDKAGKHRTHSALNRLREAGVIRVEEVKVDGKSRNRWVVSGALEG